MVISVAQRGFTFLWVLVAVAILGIGLVSASAVWQTTARQHRLEQLDWAGRQYVAAIGSYVESTPGGGRNYPARIDELLEDRRFATPRHHLREAYANPVSTDRAWELIVGPDLRIHGVRSKIPWQPDRALREWTYARPSSS